MLTNASPFVVCTASAPNVARGYTNNGFNDWLLPLKDELNAMCNYSRNPATPAAPGVPCVQTPVPPLKISLLRAGPFGFAGANDGSSSQGGALLAWAQYFVNGEQNINSKNATLSVRPVRAF